MFIAPAIAAVFAVVPPAKAQPVNIDKLLARTKAILSSPRTEWPVIAAEPMSVGGIYRQHVLLLALLPALSLFLKMSLLGLSTPFGTIRTPLLGGLGSLVLSYGLGLVMIYVMALVIDALAPTFGGQKDRVQALKTIAYSYTAAWVAGVGVLVPVLGGLIALAGGIYAIYLLYLGLPSTMRCPPQKAAGYTAVVVIIGILLALVIGMLTKSVVGRGVMSAGMSSSAPQFDRDSPLGQLEQWGKQMEAAGQQLEQAQRSGDTQAQQSAMEAMAAAVSGGGAEGGVQVLSLEQMQSLLPARLGDFERTNVAAESGGALGLNIASASADYGAGAGAIRLEITDAGAASGLLALAGMAGESERRSDGYYEKNYREQGRLVRESWDERAATGEYTVIVGQRLSVSLEGGSSLADLQAAARGLDWRALERLAAGS